jgi:cation transport ATPase
MDNDTTQTSASTVITERAERADRAEKAEQVERSARMERAENAEITEQKQRKARADKAERVDKEEQKERAARRKAAKKAEFKPIIIRDYSKVIFFYPLFIYSGIAWIIEQFLGTGIGQGWVAIIWIGIFFLNLAVVAFNFPTPKFVILCLVLVLSVIVIWLLATFTAINFSGSNALLADLLTINLSTSFYGVMFFGIGISLAFAFINAAFKSMRIEQNEVILKSALLGEVRRFPTKSIRYTKEIPDVFEYLLLGVGQITFTFGTDANVTLNTIPNIRRVTKKIDDLLDVQRVNVTN